MNLLPKIENKMKFLVFKFLEAVPGLRFVLKFSSLIVESGCSVLYKYDSPGHRKMMVFVWKKRIVCNRQQLARVPSRGEIAILLAAS